MNKLKKIIVSSFFLFPIHCYSTEIRGEALQSNDSYENKISHKKSLELEASGCTGDPSWIDYPSLPQEPTETSKSDTNCSFIQFAWQSFAYYTSDKTPDLFLNMMPKDRIFKETPDSWDNKGDQGLVQSEILQAGSNFPLNDQEGNPVFYQQSVNKKFYDDIVKHGLNNSQCVADIDSGKTPFEISQGSTEVKTSWKLISNNDNPEKFFTIHRDVEIDGAVRSNVLMGLVGIHIVRKTRNHPEFIWTTFEHKENAPDCADVPNLSNFKKSGKWTFFNPMSFKKVNTYFPGKPTQVCRETPYGVGFLTKTEVAKDIKALNEAMSHYYQSRKSVWSNYFLVGTSWTVSNESNLNKGEIPPTWKNEIGGSKLLSNSTMETYVQNPQWFALVHPKEDRGCFTCHKYNPLTKKALHLSHMFNAAQDYGPCFFKD
ncbi:Cytochrome C [Vibrio crassostreae]|nr:Cytochrome C [Vibrio crassostreae]CAK1788497.1 Cytochrome C [Vibrio crassostreae]CAK1839478.1 Cytochrome C [Vibrio crassostreae]CAK2273608.1 Cytochrome C [Vibrio crassostreae]CAK2645033.1 Cytochrome C [Vibrio crassostreae]